MPRPDGVRDGPRSDPGDCGIGGCGRAPVGIPEAVAMSHPEQPPRGASNRDVMQALERLASTRMPESSGRPHERVDAVLQSLAEDELQALARIQERWVGAGHPAGSLPDPADMAADDMGNVVNGDSKLLIATPGEWQVYARLRLGLSEPGQGAE